MKKVVVVGGGIGGLAAALALTQRGLPAHLLEQNEVFSEVGAGIQLGPNVVRVLEAMGLAAPLKSVAAFPLRLEVRDARNAELLATLPLGKDMEQRYGAAYASIARVDLHSMLLAAVRYGGLTQMQMGAEVIGVTQDEQAVQVQVARPSQTNDVLRTEALVGADGIWSRVRSQLLRGGGPRVTGHLAFRAMLPQNDLPFGLRSRVITAWMGPQFHVVQYPVRVGSWMNVVAIVHGEAPADLSNWDHSVNAASLRAKLADASTPLMDLIQAIPDWSLWGLCDRAPMRSAAEHAKGRIALLGDAAHPMRPYLAQGAGMAIEDAAELAKALGTPDLSVAQAMRLYATKRWQRNARVQARSIRNGEIFHAAGFLQRGRDLSLKLLGRRVLDVPWLYRGG